MHVTLNRTDRPRIAPRNATAAAITCQLYVSSGSINVSNGVLRNFSNEGCYIETPCEFNSGTVLLIRTIQYPSMSSSIGTQERPRSMSLAEVKWLKNLSDKETLRFGIGLRYLM
jgi:hypothetical protein